MESSESFQQRTLSAIYLQEFLSIVLAMESKEDPVILSSPRLDQLKHKLEDLAPLPLDHEMARWLSAAEVRIENFS